MTAACVALIPARSGSKRVVGKNVRPLAGHPLLAYTVSAARESGVFADVITLTAQTVVTATAAEALPSEPALSMLVSPGRVE